MERSQYPLQLLQSREHSRDISRVISWRFSPERIRSLARERTKKARHRGNPFCGLELFDGSEGQATEISRDIGLVQKTALHKKFLQRRDLRTSYTLTQIDRKGRECDGRGEEKYCSRDRE